MLKSLKLWRAKMKLISYFVFNGNTREAYEFYKEVFQAESKGLMTFGETNEPGFEMPEEIKDRILHAELQIGDSIIYFSDTMPGHPFEEKCDKISIAISDIVESKARELFEKLSKGGTVTMPLQSTFWSPCYGAVTDKFGIGWQVSVQAEVPGVK
ncbi:MAG: hypothetical protein K0R71_1908 [Bacillales bacterium]|jgi:PhnB protein|nr:hypothetical protein [Bacillales bacterium]